MAKKKTETSKKPTKDKAPNKQATTEAQSPTGQPGAQPSRQVIIHTQYIKDLSFENPNAVDAFTQPAKQPQVEIGVQVNGDKVSDDQYEVRLHLTAKANVDGKALFLVDLTYAALVSVKDAKPEEVNPLVMIEGPRQIFPFARSIISNVTRDGGFLPLNLQPVDFVAVYRHSLAQQRQATAAYEEGVTKQ